MRFNTYIPDDVLKPYVRAFAISESAEENTYKVLPGTELVIGFQYKGQLSHVDQDKQIHLSRSGLTGLHDRCRIFKNSANTGTILVYFKEMGAATFFKQPIHEFFMESISLDNFMSASALILLEEQLSEATQDLERIKMVEQFLISRMRQIKPDQLIMAAVALIYKSRGTMKMKDLTQQLYVSQSPLEKRFRQSVGTSPKKFASIIRLKHTILTYNPKNSLADLGYEAGFYDQSHFIKEFKRFTGETPEIFFS